MSIHHHPSEDFLLDYAAGASDEAVSLILATHLALCPRCRRIVASAEAAGGALLENVAPQALDETTLSHAMAKLDRAVPETPKPRAPAGCALAPEPLRSYIGGDLETVPWRKIAGGISCRDLSTHGHSKARLIRSLPGSGVGVHTHRGPELTLCLTGGFTDNTDSYARGDLQTTDGTIEHRPVADAGEPCVILAVTDAPLIFRSLPMGLLAKLFGF
jgi:putative transcriptional regulator